MFAKLEFLNCLIVHLVHSVKWKHAFCNHPILLDSTLRADIWKRMLLAVFSRRARLHLCNIYVTHEYASIAERFLCNRNCRAISYYIKKSPAVHDCKGRIHRGTTLLPVWKSGRRSLRVTCVNVLCYNRSSASHRQLRCEIQVSSEPGELSAYIPLSVGRKYSVWHVPRTSSQPLY